MGSWFLTPKIIMQNSLPIKPLDSFQIQINLKTMQRQITRIIYESRKVLI